jgi:carbamoyl-phosphate synthase small subunit
VLEDGTEYAGFSFGAAESRAGEVVFTTGMAGYPQSLTDPSFRGQILVFTYPLQGNYGVPKSSKDVLNSPFESGSVHVSGVVVAEECTAPSHWASGQSLGGWLTQNRVPGLHGIDTRALTRRLREQGVMRGKILVDGSADVTFDSGVIEHPVAEVSCKTIEQTATKGTAPHVVLVDCGVKANILRCLLARGVRVTRVPWNCDLSEISDFDGLFLSNGPGDPKVCGKTIAMVRHAFSLEKPIFGVCLGVQIMALAAGGDTYKLPYGHRGQNQPCIEVGTGRCYITSQNHGYAVRLESLPRDWEPWFINANDGTVEGIRHREKPFYAVQFHPEGCPGPRDTEYLFDKFLEDIVPGRVS